MLLHIHPAVQSQRGDQDPHDLDHWNVWQRLAPHSRLLLISLLVFAIAFTPNGKWLTWACYGLSIVPIIYWSQVQWQLLLKRLAIELAFASMILVGTLFRSGGQVLWQWEWMQVTSYGLITLGSVAIKATLCLLLLNILTLSTSIPILLQSLVVLKVPPLLVSIMAAMYFQINVLHQEFQAMYRAATTRNFSTHNLLDRHRRDRAWQRQVLGNMLGVLFVRTYDRGDRIHQAMLARGYQGVPPVSTMAASGWCDRFALAVMVLIMVLGQVIGGK
ncbi:MAG: cobalt ECF transporter T component CbiQ [Pseudanabaenaceae cyanobacterium bins.39]|nr:cobalt ECF transporter T component CbiQ [Pseudanabaenaceae cyanobacterium bins.39]